MSNPGRHHRTTDCHLPQVVANMLLSVESQVPLFYGWLVRVPSDRALFGLRRRFYGTSVALAESSPNRAYAVRARPVLAA